MHRSGTGAIRALLVLMLVIPPAAAQCFEQDYGTLVGHGDDGPLRPPSAMGFPFPFAGSSWSHVLIGNNGVLFLGNPSMPAAPTASGYSVVPAQLVGNLLGGGPKIAAFWNDLDNRQDQDGGIFLNTSQPGRCVVTWSNTVEYLLPWRKTIQVQLLQSGEIAMIYSSGFAVDRGLAVCGISPGFGAADPGPVDLSTAGATVGAVAYELFDTTAMAFDLGARQLRLVPSGNGYVVSSQACDPATHTDFGIGCGADKRSFYESFDAAHPIDLAGTTIRAVENGNGGYDVSSAPLTAFAMPTGPGLALGDDEMTRHVTFLHVLGFTWEYPGGQTSEIQIDSNGRVVLAFTLLQPISNPSPTAGEMLGDTLGSICAPNCDFVPDGTANVDNVFFETDGVGEARITWRNVPCYGSSVGNTFQVVLFHTPGPGGDGFELRYQSIVNDGSFDRSALVGFAVGPARDPGPRDLSARVPFSTATDAFDDLVLRAHPGPALGHTAVFTSTNLRPVPTFDVLGFTVLPAGIDLAPAASRCFAYLALDGSELVSLLGPGPVATWSLAIPASPVFVDLEYAVQTVQLAPGANAAGILTSNGVRGRIRAD